MYLKTVCRLCLAMDAPMRNIVDSPVQHIYEKLTNISLTMEHRPVVACHICYYQLRKCHELMVKSVRADKVLTRILQSGEIESAESTAMLIGEAHQHALSRTPVKIITIKGTTLNTAKSEIKEEPMSPQCIEESEIDGPACAEHLKLEESADKGTFLEDVDIDSQTLTDERDIEKGTDLLYVCVPIEYIKNEETIDGGNIKSGGAKNLNVGEYEGATTSEKCEQTHAVNKKHVMNLTLGGKNIPKKLTRLESTTVKEIETQSRTNSTIMHRNKNNSHNRYVSTNTSMRCDISPKTVNVPFDSDSDRCMDDSSSKHPSKDTFATVYERRFSKTSGGIKIRETQGGKNRFHCEICQRKFSRSADIRRHSRTHSAEKPFECRICKIRFDVKAYLESHLRKHTREKPYECEICKFRFSQKGNLKNHLYKHTGEKPFECEICKARFSEKGNLKKHLLKHTGEKPFQCEICKARFSAKGILKKHLYKHTGEKPFECDICKVKFSFKSNLKTHLRTHTGERPFECEICKLRFSQKGHLKIHFRTHTGEKPFECEICKVRFSQKASLNKHLRTHTGEGPFECGICKVRFSQNGQLNRHFRIHRGETF